MFIFIYLFTIYLTNVSFTEGVLQDIYWRDYVNGDIPCDAFEGAPGKYIGQVNFQSCNIPGTIYTNTGAAVVEYTFKRIVKEDIKILCSSDLSRFYWEYVDFDKPQDQQMLYAVKGGFEGAEHVQKFIGKAVHDGDWKISKVHGFETITARGLWVWNETQPSVNFRQFFILKYNITYACRKQCNTYIGA